MADDDNAASADRGLLGSLDEAEVELLRSLCPRREFKAGDTLFTEEDIGDELYLVEEGALRISRWISLDADHTLGVVGAGGILGEMAVLGDAWRSATATATADGSVLCLSAETFGKICEEHETTGFKLLKSLTRTIIGRLRTTNDLLRDTVAWGLEISGAAGMSFQKLMTSSAELTVTLLSGKRIRGRLIKVDRSAERFEIFIRDAQEQVHIIPYHAVLEMVFGVGLLTDGAPATESEEV